MIDALILGEFIISIFALDAFTKNMFPCSDA